MKPYYDEEGVQIFHADCREVLPLLAPADCVVTDPPYGVGKAAWDTRFPTEWIPLAWGVAPRMLVMSGNMLLPDAAMAVGRYRDCIALHATNGMTRSVIAFGNWIPVLACGDWKWAARPNLLPFVVNTAEQIDHPSPKPLEAMRRLLGRYTEPNWCLLDPFMGSGTTLVAARLLGRRCIGIEIEEKYCEIAAKRLQQAVLPLEMDVSRPSYGQTSLWEDAS